MTAICAFLPLHSELASGRNPPTCDVQAAVWQVRFTSIRDIKSVATNFRLGSLCPFAETPRNGRCLREADFRDNALFVRLETGPEIFAG